MSQPLVKQTDKRTERVELEVQYKYRDKGIERKQRESSKISRLKLCTPAPCKEKGQNEIESSVAV